MIGKADAYSRATPISTLQPLVVTPDAKLLPPAFSIQKYHERDVQLDAAFWRDASSTSFIYDEETGDLIVGGDQPHRFRGVETLSGVWLQKGLVDVLVKPEVESSEPVATAGGASKGEGRPANKHGEAIATVTLKLLNRYRNDPRNVKADEIADMLEEEYQRLTGAKPARSSLKLYAGGIARAVREYLG